MNYTTTISSVIASTTTQVWAVVTTAMQPLWVFLIGAGAVVLIAGIIRKILLSPKARARYLEKNFPRLD